MSNYDIDELFKRFAELDRELKELKQELSEIKPWVREYYKAKK